MPQLIETVAKAGIAVGVDGLLSVYDRVSPFYDLEYVPVTASTYPRKVELTPEMCIRDRDKAATEVCRMFDPNVKRVFANLGWEQEYFLVDTALYNACLLYTSRCV